MMRKLMAAVAICSFAVPVHAPRPMQDTLSPACAAFWVREQRAACLRSGMPCASMMYLPAKPVQTIISQEKRAELEKLFERCDKYDMPYGWSSDVGFYNRFTLRIIERIKDRDVEGLRQVLEKHKSACQMLGWHSEEYVEKFIQMGLSGYYDGCRSPLIEAMGYYGSYSLNGQNEKLAMMELLLAYGARPEGYIYFDHNADSFCSSNSALHYAAKHNERAVFAALLKYTKHVNVRNASNFGGRTAREIAGTGYDSEIAGMIDTFIKEHPDRV